VWVESRVGSLGSIWNEIVRVEVGNKLCEVVLSICLQSVSVSGSNDECCVVSVGVDVSMCSSSPDVIDVKEKKSS
jgi:hypothetical protein